MNTPQLQLVQKSSDVSVLTSINDSNTIQKFVSGSQFQALNEACRGEEGQFFEDMLASLATLIDTMPVIHYAYPTVAKYYLQKRGFPISLYTRRKVETCTEEVKAEVDELFELVNAVSKEVGIA